MNSVIYLVLHFMAGFVLSYVAISAGIYPIVAFVLTIAIAFLKEYAEEMDKGKFDWYTLLAMGVGAMTPLTIFA